MENKFQIPEMSTEEIAKWYSTIKPIVRLNGTSYYLRTLSPRELTHTAYTWLNAPSDWTDVVDYSKLSVIADVKMLHTWGYHGFFKPIVGEVIRQIPKDILKDVVAFKIIVGAIGINTIYRPELNAGFHVSVVRLYKTKDNNSVSAPPVNYWPTNNYKCPIGMEEKDFQYFLDLIE